MKYLFLTALLAFAGLAEANIRGRFHGPQSVRHNNAYNFCPRVGKYSFCRRVRADFRHSNHENSYDSYHQDSYYQPKEDYYHDSCKSLEWSKYGFPYCSDSYYGGYEKNHYDCLEYGWECNQSCVKKGVEKCYGSYHETKYYFHRPQSLRHSAHDSYDSYYKESCPTEWSDYGFYWCTDDYSGGYEKNQYDCLEYGYQCQHSCVKKGSVKCYGHEDSYYSPPATDYYTPSTDHYTPAPTTSYYTPPEQEYYEPPAQEYYEPVQTPAYY